VPTTFSRSGAAIVATLADSGLVRVVSAGELRERFRYSLPGAYWAGLCGDSSLLIVATPLGTVSSLGARQTCLGQSQPLHACHRLAGRVFVRHVVLLERGGGCARSPHPPFQRAGHDERIGLCALAANGHAASAPTRAQEASMRFSVRTWVVVAFRGSA
jgi:hypothetical protein